MKDGNDKPLRDAFFGTIRELEEKSEKGEISIGDVHFEVKMLCKSVEEMLNLIKL